MFKVVVNQEQQFAIWPADRGNPAAWTDVGIRGTSAECAEHVERLWTDMRPDSVRRANGGLAPGGSSSAGLELESGSQTSRLVHSLFEDCVRSSAKAQAISTAINAISYEDLNRYADRVARKLIEAGVKIEDRVGICLERSIEMAAGVLGVLKAGAAYVPVDQNLPASIAEWMLADAKASVLLTSTQSLRRWPPSNRKIFAIEDWLQGSQDAPLQRVPISVDSLAYVLYTSGSTGNPKGVMVQHSALVNYLEWARGSYCLDQGSGAPMHSSLGFDLTVTSFLLPLVSGRTVYAYPQEPGWWGLVRSARKQRGLSLVKITPAHLDLIARALRDIDVSHWCNRFVVGGENLTTKSVLDWRRRAPDTVVVNEYGPTETTVGCCVFQVDRQTTWTGDSVPIGRPIANTELHVLDENLRPVPTGSIGELCIGGRGVARGYLNLPGLTASTFIPDPFSSRPGARMYRTGDLVRSESDGNLVFVGRFDTQVKIRGYRIELGEIEAALNSHPDVAEAAVVTADVLGQRELVAYVVTALRQDALVRHLANRLPQYMVPGSFVFVSALPLNSNGKVDRKALSAVKP